MTMNAITRVQIDDQTSQHRNILVRVPAGVFRCWITGALVFVAVLGLAICSSDAFAQSQSGLSTIQGTVTDSSGAVIRDATIHIVNKCHGSGVRREIQRRWVLPGTGPGRGNLLHYGLGPNMKTYVYTLDLLATQTAVVNPVMSAGAVSEQVLVRRALSSLRILLRRRNHVHP